MKKIIIALLIGTICFSFSQPAIARHHHSGKDVLIAATVGTILGAAIAVNPPPAPTAPPSIIYIEPGYPPAYLWEPGPLPPPYRMPPPRMPPPPRHYHRHCHWH